MRLLWHSAYWDGPLSGMCLLDGRKHWFRICGRSLDLGDDKRMFEIVYLTDDQIEAEDKWHAIFKEHVGTHCDYDEFNNRAVGATKPQSEWHKFYDLPLLDRNYTNVIATVSETKLRA